MAGASLGTQCPGNGSYAGKPGEAGETQKVKPAHLQSPERKGEPAGTGADVDFSPQAPKSPGGGQGGRLSPALAAGAG